MKVRYAPWYLKKVINCYEIISRDVSQGLNKVTPKEAFAPVSNKKKLMRSLEIIESKVLPIILVIFSLVYWTCALIVYFG